MPALPTLRRASRDAAVPLGVFAASASAVIAVAYLVKVAAGYPALTDVLGRWDGAWYLRIAEHGYTRNVPAGAAAGQTSLAFFPVYPLLVRGLHALTGLSRETCGVAISLAASAAASVVVWRLARRLCDEPTAGRAVALLAFFPGAFALAMVYAEGVFLLCAAVCLLALVEERWVLAGAAAALAGATRPNGLLLAACCLWAAAAAARRDRSWRPLVAPLLAPVGFAAFLVYLGLHTGDAMVLFRTQSVGWGQRFDGGITALSTTAGLVTNPLEDLNELVRGLTLVAAAAGAVLLWRWRPPPVLAIYAAGAVLPSVVTAAFTLTPRILMTAFPLLVGAARELEGRAFPAALALSAGLMATLLFVTGATLGFTP